MLKFATSVILAQRKRVLQGQVGMGKVVVHEVQGHRRIEVVNLAGAATGVAERRLPPVTQLTIGSLALVLIGGIVMAGCFPDPPPLAVPVALLAGSAILWAAGLLLLSRHPEFTWAAFFRVARWALLAYVVIAGIIEYTFVHNQASSAPLLVLGLMLVMFALDVALSISFTVARFQEPSPH